MKIPIYIINLDKDYERLQITEKEIHREGHKYKRIKGVYGKNLSNKQKQKYSTIFCSNFCTDSMIGCALSHIKAWKTLVKNKDEYALILEDDVNLVNNFDKEMYNALNNVPENYDMLYLGYTVGTKDGSHNMSTLITQTLTGVKQTGKIINDAIHIPFFPMALHSYILSYKGAKKLLSKFENDKIFNHIDFQLTFYKNDLNIYATNTDLVTQRKSNDDSNNTMTYPVLLNKPLQNVKMSHNEPLAYLLNVPCYQICGIPVNIYNSVLFTLFILLGYLNVNGNIILVSYIIYNIIELYFDSNNINIIMKLPILLVFGYIFGNIVSHKKIK